MIYDRGITDDNTVQGTAPVFSRCRRLSNDTGAAVLVTGHPGLGGGRRFRGTSAWRGWFDSEYHMADGAFSTEKHKYAPKRGWSYTIEYPFLHAMDAMGAMGRAASQMSAIKADMAANPGDSDAARARRLAPSMGLSVDHVRRLLRAAREG